MGKIKGNNVKALEDEFFKDEFGKYELDEKEAKHYHVAAEVREFRTEGEEKIRTSKPHVKKINSEVFKKHVDMGGFKGMVYEVLHDPTKQSK